MAETCLYCPRPANGREHVVPAALGGQVRLVRPKLVCRTCNSGFLSELDKELCSKSPVSLLVAQELGKNPLYVWDVGQNGIFMEAHPSSSWDGMRLWPQLILDRQQRQMLFCSDWEELQAIGRERFARSFYEHLRFARYCLRQGRKWEKRVWTWELIVGDSPRQFPPRVFVRKTFDEFSPRMHFICRYANEDDRRAIMRAVDKWGAVAQKFKMRATLGSHTPKIGLHFRPQVVLRALVKLGINLLAWRSELNRDTFQESLRFVKRGGDRYTSWSAQVGGFTIPGSVADLNCPTGAHKFKFVQENGLLSLRCAFFGGRAGAFVKFPGSCGGNWRTLDVTSFVRSKQMDAVPSSLVFLANGHTSAPRTTWQIDEILSSIPLTNPIGGWVPMR